MSLANSTSWTNGPTPRARQFCSCSNYQHVGCIGFSDPAVLDVIQDVAYSSKLLAEPLPKHVSFAICCIYVLFVSFVPGTLAFSICCRRWFRVWLDAESLRVLRYSRRLYRGVVGIVKLGTCSLGSWGFCAFQALGSVHQIAWATVALAAFAYHVAGEIVVFA